MKTARFTELVRTAGKPEPYTLWTDPKKDKTFQSALRQHRVLSVHQETVGTKADYGKVGYEHDRQGQILIFPKSIERFADRKIIGVKYELLEEPKEAPRSKAKPTTREKKKPAQAVKPKPEPPPVEEPQESGERAELDRDELVKGIRKVMKLLDNGKAVAAYHTLGKLV